MDRQSLLKRLLALPAALLWWRKKEPEGLETGMVISTEEAWGRFSPNVTQELKAISREDFLDGTIIWDWTAFQRGVARREAKFWSQYQ